MSDWRTMESAPRDGTSVLLCTHDGALYFGCWAKSIDTGDAAWRTAAVPQANGDLMCVIVRDEKIVRWMPAPDPPELPVGEAA